MKKFLKINSALMAIVVLAASCNITVDKKSAADSLKMDSLKKDSLEKDSVKKQSLKDSLYKANMKEDSTAVDTGGTTGPKHPPGKTH